MRVRRGRGNRVDAGAHRFPGARSKIIKYLFSSLKTAILVSMVWLDVNFFIYSKRGKKSEQAMLINLILLIAVAKE